MYVTKIDLLLFKNQDIEKIRNELNAFPGVFVKEVFNASEIILIDYMGDNLKSFENHFKIYGAIDYSRSSICKNTV